MSESACACVPDSPTDGNIFYGRRLEILEQKRPNFGFIKYFFLIPQA